MPSEHVRHAVVVRYDVYACILLRMQRGRKTAMGASTNNLAKVSRGSVHCL